jgi:hypothetical protein
MIIFHEMIDNNYLLAYIRTRVTITNCDFFRKVCCMGRTFAIFSEKFVARCVLEVTFLN